MGFFKCSGACAPQPAGLSLASVVSLTPFVATFGIVFVVVNNKVFPRLSRLQNARDGEDHFLPASAPALLRQVHAEHGSRSLRRRLAAITLATTIGLAAVLAELILSEISDLVEARARDAALRVTVPALLLLLVAIIPFLELQSILSGAGWSFQRSARGKIPTMAWTLLLTAFSVWLFAFWSVGMLVPNALESYMYTRGARDAFDSTGVAMAYRWATSSSSLSSSASAAGNAGGSRFAMFSSPSLRALQQAGAHGLARACLERIGVIGIWLMAMLSGFASVSSPWQMFTNRRLRKRRPVTDTDLSRRKTGVDATSDMLMAKRKQLRMLQQNMMDQQQQQQQQQQAWSVESIGSGRISSSSSSSSSHESYGNNSGIFGKLVGTIKHMGNSVGSFNSTEAAEIQSLEMEISGLETMQANLSSTLASLQARRAAEARLNTRVGQLLAVPNYVFGIYCVYRIAATTMMALHRAYYPEAAFASSDPINRFLGLLARHWDPKLDQIAWARQMSFLLSGVILAASAGSVLQTLRLFSKWMPGLVYQAQVNLALVVGQVTATYVISSAMLLRTNLPKEVGSAVGDALESALEPAFVDRWFETWFLVATAVTAVGLWIGRKLQGNDLDGLEEWDDYYGAEEMGQKQS